MFASYISQRRMSMIAILVTIATILLTACGGTETSNNPTPTPTKAAPVTSTPTHSTINAIATLVHVPNGTADLNWDASSKALTVKVSLIGLAPNSTHPSHIHEGSCSKPGKDLYPLQNIVADEHGVGTSTSTIQNVTEGIPAEGWYLGVYNGPGLSSEDEALTIVCADISNQNSPNTANQSIQVALKNDSIASSGQSATGKAKLTLTGHTLTVVLSLNGLAPNSSHMTHIHSGSCSNQGKALYPLKTIHADAEGTSTETTTIQDIKEIPSTGWYINVHRTTDISTQTGFDPIACGNITIG